MVSRKRPKAKNYAMTPKLKEKLARARHNLDSEERRMKQEINIAKDKSGIRSLEIKSDGGVIKTPSFGFTDKDFEKFVDFRGKGHIISLPNSIYEFVWEFKQQKQLDTILYPHKQKELISWLKNIFSGINAVYKNISLQFGSKLNMNLNHIKSLYKIQTAAVPLTTVPLIPNVSFKQDILDFITEKVDNNEAILPQYYLTEDEIPFRRKALNEFNSLNIPRVNIVARTPNTYMEQYKEIYDKFDTKEIWVHGTQLWDKATHDVRRLSEAHLIYFSSCLDSFTFANRSGGGKSDKAYYFDEGTYQYKLKNLSEPAALVRTRAIESSVQSFKNIRESITAGKVKKLIEHKSIFNNAVRDIGIRID